MTDTDDQHKQFSEAIIAGVLEFPSFMDEPELAALQPREFYADYNKLWETMRALHNDGGINTARIVAVMGPGSGYDFAFFARLRAQFQNVPMDEMRDYANGMKDRAQKKRLDEVAGQLARDIRSEMPPQVAAGLAMERLAKIAMLEEHNPRSLRDILTEVHQDILDRYANPSEIWGIAWGFPRLDRFTGGWQERELTMLTGDSGLGKTYWATQIAMQAAKSAPGAFFSMEMGEKSIARRMLKIEGVDGRRIQTGNILDNDWPIIDNAIAQVSSLPITLDSKKYGLNDIRAEITKLISDKGIQWAIIDYLLLMDVPAKDEIEKTAKVSAFIKSICNDLGIRIVLIHSLNKQGMDSESADKSNMRGSGQVVYDADNIFVLNPFKPTQNPFEQAIMPNDYTRIIRMTIKKGREMDFTGGSLLYMRKDASPKFTELDPDESRVTSFSLKGA